MAKWLDSIKKQKKKKQFEVCDRHPNRGISGQIYRVNNVDNNES